MLIIQSHVVIFWIVWNWSLNKYLIQRLILFCSFVGDRKIFYWVIDWSVDWVIWVSDWLMDWLIEWLALTYLFPESRNPVWPRELSVCIPLLLREPATGWMHAAECIRESESWRILYWNHALCIRDHVTDSESKIDRKIKFSSTLSQKI